MAAADAMGLALVAPGSSLHRELELLTESGLTPYEAMRAAVVVPAQRPAPRTWPLIADSAIAHSGGKEPGPKR